MRNIIFIGAVVALAGCSDPAADHLNGYVEAETLYMAPQEAGVIGDILVKEGDSVGAGDVLFHMQADRIAYRASKAAVNKVMQGLATMLEPENLKARIIAGSIRHLMDVNNSFLAGAHIVTITPPILRKMLWNPQSERTIEEFNSIWREMKKKGNIR